MKAVTSAKMEFEFAFNHAWRRWAKASNFPSFRGADPGNLFWIGVGKSERRRAARAAWNYGRWAEPYVMLDGWTIDDCLKLHADDRADIKDWKNLGRLYIEYFKPERIKRLTE